MKIKGYDAHLKRLKRISGDVMVREVGKAIYAAADMHAADAAHSITQGAVSGKNHVPSAPGQPPNADTHLLDRSIHVEKTGPLSAKSVADAPYAAALEKGSERKAGVSSRSFSAKSKKQGPIRMEYGDSRTEERPFMRPAAKRVRPEAEKLVVKAVKRVVRGGTV